MGRILVAMVFTLVATLAAAEELQITETESSIIVEYTGDAALEPPVARPSAGQRLLPPTVILKGQIEQLQRELEVLQQSVPGETAEAAEVRHKALEEKKRELQLRQEELRKLMTPRSEQEQQKIQRDQELLDRKQKIRSLNPLLHQGDSSGK